MYQFSSKEEHEKFLKEQSALPQGFSCSTLPLTFFPQEKKLDAPLPMNLTLIALNEPSDSFAGVFTRNAFPGHPVILGRELIQQPLCSGIVINNKISNVCTTGGYEDSSTIKNAVEQELQGQGFVLPCSTGIIGWKLPVSQMVPLVPDLVKKLQNDSILPAAKGIMTTDAFPKARTALVDGVRITAIAKGAGMIEPNMATMLVFILTDGDVKKETLQKCLNQSVNRSFNRISVDSDQSTSDTAFILSSKRKAVKSIVQFQQTLDELCFQLSDDIVRNGEGTGHVMDVQVEGAPTDEQALGMARALVNAPLTKTAIFGNDPNVGRILQALGKYAGNRNWHLNKEGLKIYLGEELVMEGGSFKLDQPMEDRLFTYLKGCALEIPCPGFPAHGKRVLIKLELAQGEGRARVLGSDLSYEYVRENADYRS